MPILFDPLPEGIESSIFVNDEFTFEYPADARIAIFERGELPDVVRVVYDLPEKRCRFNIERIANATSAREAAEQAFEGAALSMAGNVVPFLLSIPVEGWRLRKRFADGGREPDVIDMVFVRLGTGVYQLSLICPPKVYEQVKWAFDLLAQTFRPMT